MHWTQRHAIRDEWFWKVKLVCGVREPAEERPARLTIVRVGKRLLDPSNLISATKPIIDALVQFGHLRGDRPQDVTHGFGQRRCGPGEDSCMELTITYS